MKQNAKEKCMTSALSALSLAAKKAASHSLNEMSIATWYQPKIDMALLSRNRK